FFGILSKELNEKVDQDFMMKLILEKLLGNLCFWSKNLQIVHKSIEMIDLITKGYESYKVSSKCQVVQNLLENNFADMKPFLSYPRNFKERTLFYSIFTRFVVNEMDEKKFEHFLKPFDETFLWLSKRNDFNSPETVHTTIGLFRDLKGVCLTTTKKSKFLFFKKKLAKKFLIKNRKLFNQFFDWFHWKHFDKFMLLFEVHSITPEVATPMLRFLSEFVYNRGYRLNFSGHSTYGHHLFRSAQKALSTYGTRLSSISTENVGDSSHIYKI
ncbi:hypothetical protein MHBO_003699, partial [Bonamia ostreae]